MKAMVMCSLPLLNGVMLTNSQSRPFMCDWRLMMKEITIRSKSVVKLSDGKYNADWTFNAGTPVLSVIKSISTDYEQLQRQNDELVARVARLESEIKWIADTFEIGSVEHLLRVLLDESPTQSLQHIEAAAVERFANELGVYDLAYDDQEYVEVPRYRIKEYIAELRQQSTNDGSDGDE